LHSPRKETTQHPGSLRFQRCLLAGRFQTILICLRARAGNRAAALGSAGGHAVQCLKKDFVSGEAKGGGQFDGSHLRRGFERVREAVRWYVREVEPQKVEQKTDNINKTGERITQGKKRRSK
jgi:hypothetical protein